MKIVIIHQYFKTPDEGGGIRTWHIGQQLVEKGHEVTVLSGHNTKSGVHAFGDLKVHYFKIPYKNEFGFGRRLISFYQFVRLSRSWCRKNRDFDLAYVLSTPLTTGLAALYIRKKLSKPYVFEVGDLWPDVPVQLGIIKNKPLTEWLYKLERKIYENAKGLVGLSPAITEAMHEKAPHILITTVTNMSDLNWAEKPDLTERDITPGRPLVISYFGAIGYANQVSYLLEAARACMKESLPVKFQIMGFGAYSDKIRSDGQKLPHVEWINPAGMTKVKSMLSDSDACYISYRKHPILSTGSPNKFFDGLAMGQLIITNFHGWIGEQIERNDCGFSYSPEDTPLFIEKLKAYIQDPGKLAQAKQNARRLAESTYDVTQQCEHLENFILRL